MGGSCFLAYLAAWLTFFYVLSSFDVTSGDQRLLQDLGLHVLPDISKINISLDEYTTVMREYLQSRENSADDAKIIPNLVTYDVDQKVVWRSSSVRLRFSVPLDRRAKVEEAQLRFLVPPQLNDDTIVRVQVNLILGERQRRLMEEKTLYLSRNSTKWCEIDVSSAVQSWIRGEVNLGLELLCLDFKCDLDPIDVAVTTLVHPGARRMRRASPYETERRTDCQKGRKKKKCCRQNMKVDFSKLGFPEMAGIVAPKLHNVGYCHGLCPPNYNFATNHSRIQSLMHQMEKRNGSTTSKKIIPRTCCAPSKLKHLDIILVDKDNHSKLRKEVWDNMDIVECACS
ncbi:unnamed protein product [Phaedon cochleariae]|uniref:TGF-beta family profile domain-containing protein n=1 Tax=Phaedon cochleariae TaxID=80249 RepID=A0A9P0GNT4_PHACE|nr:unnamed protein product [Phaedon cochleariae]